MNRIGQIKIDFLSALERLSEAASSAKSELEIDGVIQRFEFTFELCWKLLKFFLEKEGIISNSPRNCFKEAYKLELITDEKIWLKMLADRNHTVHIYSKKESRDIFKRIKTNYVNLFNKLLKDIQAR